MNRREFFSFAAVAPVALPMAAKAIAERMPFVTGGVVSVSEFMVGETLSGDGSFLMGKSHIEEAMEALRAGRISINQLREIEGLPPIEDFAPIEAQMAEHDLFELNCQGDHEFILQSLASPEDQNLIS